MKLSFSLVFCLLVSAAWGQFPGQVQDQVPAQPDTASGYEKEKKPDSLRQRVQLRSFRVGTDLITLIKGQTMSTFSGWELNGDVDLGKFYLAVDVGNWARKYDIHTDGDYHNTGTYWRAGLDANLLKKDPDRNMFFLGFRYGSSSFNESSSVIIKDKLVGNVPKQLVNSSLTASWAELVAGLRVKVWKDFWMGYTARMKVAPSVKGDDAFKAYDIPGYGLNAKTFYWGFNYQIFWQIPFKREKKKPESPPKE